MGSNVFTEAFMTLGVGLGVVFVGLICLIVIIKLMSFIVRLLTKKSALKANIGVNKPIAPKNDFVTAQVQKPRISGSVMTVEQRRQLIAAVSASIAQYLGTDVTGIRLHSIKRADGAVMQADERRMLVAAISTAIASEMGADVSAISIRSIRKV